MAVALVATMELLAFTLQHIILLYYWPVIYFVAHFYYCCNVGVVASPFGVMTEAE